MVDLGTATGDRGAASASFISVMIPLVQSKSVGKGAAFLGCFACTLQLECTSKQTNHIFTC